MFKIIILSQIGADRYQKHILEILLLSPPWRAVQWQFLKNSQRIPKEFRKNSERIPKEFPKNSQGIPKEFQKFL